MMTTKLPYILMFILFMIQIGNASESLTDLFRALKKGLKKEMVDKRYIYLIRHAKKTDTANNAMKTTQNYLWDLHEGKKGTETAENLATYFKTKYDAEALDFESRKKPLIYVSPFKRCIKTAIPTAKALNAKIRIEYGLYEFNHGFPSEEEIKSFYAGDEEYIDTEYQSLFPRYAFEIKGSEYEASKFFWILPPKQLQDETEENFSRRQNEFLNFEKKKRKLSEERYGRHSQIAILLRMMQKKTNRDIIVVSHQEEVYEIGGFLVEDVYNGDFIVKPRNSRNFGQLHFQIDATHDAVKGPQAEKAKWHTGQMSIYSTKEDDPNNYEVIEKLPRWERKIREKNEEADKKWLLTLHTTEKKI